MRVFFMVPQPWTDAYLPLSVSVPAQITRVMVGRIELVTPAQRTTLREIARLPVADIVADADRLHSAYYARLTTRSSSEVARGRQSLKEFGVSVPKSYAQYLSLGRFRNALILDEARRAPTPALARFISRYGLEGYQPTAVMPPAPTPRPDPTL
jgi:hypothetical protein